MSQLDSNDEGPGPSPIPPFGPHSMAEESTAGPDLGSRSGFPDQPVDRSADPASAPKGGGRFALLAVGISLLALVTALSSAVFAWRAIDQAQDAKDIAIGRAPVQVSGPTADADGGSATSPTEPAEQPDPNPTESGPSVPSAGPDDVPRSPGEPPILNERTVYAVKYTKQTLTLNATCSRSMYADLDEPRANVGADTHDLRLRASCGGEPPSLRLGDGAQGSESAKPGMTPQECADKVRTEPIQAEAPIPVRKGVMLCVMTDYAAAHARGEQWRLILLEIVSVGNDGAVSIQASAWDIPG